MKREIHGRIPRLLYLLVAITAFYTQFTMEHFSTFSDATQWFEYIAGNRSLYISGLLSFFLMNLYDNHFQFPFE